MPRTQPSSGCVERRRRPSASASRWSQRTTSRNQRGRSASTLSRHGANAGGVSPCWSRFALNSVSPMPSRGGAGAAGLRRRQRRRLDRGSRDRARLAGAAAAGHQRRAATAASARPLRPLPRPRRGRRSRSRTRRRRSGCSPGSRRPAGSRRSRSTSRRRTGGSARRRGSSGPADSKMTSPSRCSSNASWYWKPLQPPPRTPTRRPADDVSASCAERNSWTFSAPLEVNSMPLAV